MVLGKLKEKLLQRGSDQDDDDGGLSGPPRPSKPAFLKKAFIIEKLLPLADGLESFFPNMQRELSQAEMEDEDPVEYLAESIYQAISLAVMLIIAMAAMAMAMDDYGLLTYTLLGAPVVVLFGTFTFAKRPRVKAKKRTRQLEKELPYALRHILIEVEAGISLYQAMVSVTEGYGEASNEFRKIVNEINAGKSEVEALENAIVRNPSQQYRRALWQIINSLKSGADVSTTLESLVDSIMKKQILAVEKYGQELNPYTLMYMMIAIIMPSLGVTFLMILSTFTGIQLSDMIFYGILVGLFLFQLVFLNLVDSKRPQVKT